MPGPLKDRSQKGQHRADGDEEVSLWLGRLSTAQSSIVSCLLFVSVRLFALCLFDLAHVLAVIGRSLTFVASRRPQKQHRASRGRLYFRLSGRRFCPQAGKHMWGFRSGHLRVGSDIFQFF